MRDQRDTLGRICMSHTMVALSFTYPIPGNETCSCSDICKKHASCYFVFLVVNALSGEQIFPVLRAICPKA